MTLQVITTVTDEIVQLIRDDPVRPEIPLSQRINVNSRIYVLQHAAETHAVTCVKFLNMVPAAVDDLMIAADSMTTAVFYTIWSYASGAGRDLIIQARKSIEQEMPQVHTFVTLSPKTEMARRFHLRNGAGIYRENSDTINYIYK